MISKNEDRLPLDLTGIIAPCLILILLSPAAAMKPGCIGTRSFAPPASEARLSQGPEKADNEKADKTTQGFTELHDLQPGKTIRSEIARGQSHGYQLSLASNQYLHVVIDQTGADVVVTIIGADGKTIAEADSPNGGYGREHVSILADAPGVYFLKVAMSRPLVVGGSYEIAIKEDRLATAEDHIRFAAQNKCSEARKLAGLETAESLREAINKYEEALKSWQGVGDRQAEAYALVNIGLCYASAGENRQAIAFYNRAQPQLQSLRDRPAEAYAITNMADAYKSTGDLKQALDLYLQVLPAWQAIGDRESEASVVFETANLYNMLGKNHDALDYFKRDLPLQRANGSRMGELMVLTYIGIIYNLFGETQNALEYHSQVLDLTKTWNAPASHARALSNVAGLYLGLGEPQRALDLYQQALQKHKELKDRDAESNTLNNIARTLNELGDKQAALEYYNQALLLHRELKNQLGTAGALNNIGRLYLDMGDQQKALEYFQQALPLSQSAGGRLFEARILANMGKVYLAVGDKGKALANLNQSLSIRRAGGDRSGEVITLYDLAHLARDSGDLAEARATIEAAINIIESLRVKIANQDLRASYLASKQEYFNFYVDLLMRMNKQDPSAGHDATALQVSERARARSLLEELAETRYDIRQGVDAALIKRERELQEMLNAKAEQKSVVLSGKHTKEKADAIESEIEALATDYDAVSAQIRARSPRYAALTRPVPLSLKEVRERVLDSDTMLLEYALGNERSYLWAVTTTSILSFELPGRKEIEGQARRLYNLLTERNRRVNFETSEEKRVRVANAEAEFPEAASALSRTILGPVSGQLKSKRLLIVADGALQYVPFSVLPAGDPRGGDYSPLVMNHEIVSLPSASVLAVIRAEISGRKAAPKTLAVLADPVFSKNDKRFKTIMRPVEQGQAQAAEQNRREGQNKTAARETAGLARDFGGEGGVFERLHFTQQEAEAILSLVPAGKRKAALGFEASRATATDSELSQYRFLHFATHGFLDTAHPALSGMVLSLVDQRGMEQNGFLRAIDIFNLRFPAELVVLSGCKTGLGKEIKGEGLVGLTRAFMYAGAARVLVSLWDVNDKATAEMMTEFYKRLLNSNSMSPAAALREAQLSIMKKWQSPYYWAPFVIQGEPK
jgi:CHAT domain-containing protein